MSCIIIAQHTNKVSSRKLNSDKDTRDNITKKLLVLSSILYLSSGAAFTKNADICFWCPRGHYLFECGGGLVSFFCWLRRRQSLIRCWTDKTAASAFSGKSGLCLLTYTSQEYMSTPYIRCVLASTSRWYSRVDGMRMSWDNCVMEHNHK